MPRKSRKQRKSEADLIFAIIGFAVLVAMAFPDVIFKLLQFVVGAVAIGAVSFSVVVFLRRSRQQKTQTFEQSPTGKSEKIIETPASQPTPKPAFIKPSVSSKLTPQNNSWSLELIKSLEWKRFEELCVSYFRLKGHKAAITSLGADGGIDILLYGTQNPDQLLGVVQCKAWAKKPVGVKEIRELFGIMADRGCPLGIFIATSEFTTGAEEFANGKHIKLMDGGQLLALILELPTEKQELLLAKMTAGNYTVPSCPQCGTKLISRTASRGPSKGKSFWGCRNFPRCRYTLNAKSA